MADELLSMMRVIIYGMAVLSIVSGLTLAIWALLIAKEDYLTRKAKRELIQAETKAKGLTITHAPHDHQIVVSSQGEWRHDLLHLEELDKQSFWRKLHTGKSIERDIVQLEELDLITVFTQATQSYAIIGGQQTGKTFQARHIANYWLNQGIQPLVIGPKWDKGEWTGCTLAGGNGDFEAVELGIQLVRMEAEKRHSSARGHKEHGTLPIFFDDWTPIVDSVSNARMLILEATTLYASVNIILYFILHSDTNEAWGVDRKGAALKQNFIKLFIEPSYDDKGIIIRHQTTGYIRFAAETIDRPVKLFYHQPAEIGRTVNLDKERCRVLLGQKQIGGNEERIIRMYKEGMSKGKICEAIWGYRSSNKYPEIEEIIRKNISVQ